MTEPETTWIVEKFNDPETKELCTLCGLKPAILARRTGQPTHGLCHDCWYTKFKAGTVNAENRKKKLCKVQGCDAPAKARGFCGSHYDKWREHGIDGFPPFQTVKPDWRTKAVPETTKPKPTVKKSIFVNLNGYDILDDLADAAHTHMRPVDMQALAYIVAGLKNDGYGKEEKQ